MNGIERITQRIGAEAQAEAERVLSSAREEAAKITAKYKAQADAEAADLAAKNAKAAVEREERLVSVAQMEARKVQLAAKQEMVEKTYALALEKLCAIPEEQYTQVLADLLVQASSTGREEAVFSAGDRDRVGKAAVARANEILAKRAALEGCGSSEQGGHQRHRQGQGHGGADPVQGDPSHPGRLYSQGRERGGQLHL